MNKKALGIGFSAAAAASIAAMIATGFIHEEKAPTPDECMQSLITDAQKIREVGPGGVIDLTATPEAQEADSKFRACMIRVAEAKNGWNIGFGWK